MAGLVLRTKSRVGNFPSPSPTHVPSPLSPCAHISGSLTMHLLYPVCRDFQGSLFHGPSFSCQVSIPFWEGSVFYPSNLLLLRAFCIPLIESVQRRTACLRKKLRTEKNIPRVLFPTLITKVNRASVVIPSRQRKPLTTVHGCVPPLSAYLIVGLQWNLHLFSRARDLRLGEGDGERGARKGKECVDGSCTAACGHSTAVRNGNDSPVAQSPVRPLSLDLFPGQITLPTSPSHQ
ncbi:hypothetical protein BO86DRAFT_202984 [Aspergillus japonicus CBS 114.51]|uniref:Uncharacterized protein n=1 Tax=Aspergillus japonicus CBS 114.51 TaxID=1448312 RepID=A0A8T8WRL3_ASPJA|nr:hypothetical protein BO86DRAFT_202984 [Aspergillus japonicus CBS 114.51]RAH77959.1 hypothetical protein BO86DRAFT_202984 [Aspergillus japonicus CBS 114.51]